jgi:hypothetical protein
LLLLLLLNALDAKSENYKSPQQALSKGPCWGINKRMGSLSLLFLIRQGLKYIMVLFTSLLLELAEIEFWPAFV